MKMKQKVVVVGMGYVGFPLSCAIVKSGKYNVVGIDLDPRKLASIRSGVSPVEDRQAEIDIKTINVRVTDDYAELDDAQFVIVCVPTPVNEEKEPDLGPVRAVAHQVSTHLTSGQIIILESTVNPGVCEEEVLPILEESGLKAGIDFDIVHCPERIDPANPNWNVYNIPRNIGGTTVKGTHKAAEFYRSFLEGQITELSCLKVAEATKIVENTFRDINIAYVNELAKSFDVMGIDIIEVLHGASSKPFGFMPHYPGCGVGGHCIPVDPYYLIAKAKKMGFDHVFLKAARDVNNSMEHYTVEKLIDGLNTLEKSVKGTRIGILGMSYKANIGDLRESPSLKIVKMLKHYEPELLLCDPHIKDDSYVPLDTVLAQAEVIMVLAGHKAFLEIKDWHNVKLIIDGRNCLDKVAIEKLGIVYRGIGR